MNPHDRNAYDLEIPLKHGDVLRTNQGNTYVIVGTLNSGMRADIFLVKLEQDVANPSSQTFVAKVPSIDQTRTERDIRERILHLREDMLNELNAWNRLQYTPTAKHMFSTVEGSGTFRTIIKNRITFLDFIIQSLIDGVSLESWCKSHYGELSGTDGELNFTGIHSEAAWFNISRQLVQLIKVIHDQRVVHGDLWPPNLLMTHSEASPVNCDRPILIDFGRAWLLDHEFHQRGKDKRRFPYYAPEVWYKEGKTWYAPADIYSLGGVLYFLATGDDPPSPYKGNLDHDVLDKLTSDELKARTKSNTELKEELVGQITLKNIELYAANPGIVDIIHYCLRTRVHERASHAGAVLDVMEIFQSAFHRPASSLPTPNIATPQPVLTPNELLDKLIVELETIDNPLFHRLAVRTVSNLKSQISDATTRLYNILGDREDIVNSLLASLSCLTKGDQCLALTTPIFWRRHNIGANGRFLTMLKLAALNGVSVRWVLLVNRHDLQDRSVRTIMQAQCNAMIELGSPLFRVSHHTPVSINDKSMNGSGYYCGWCQLEDNELEGILRSAKTFIALNKQHNDADNVTLYAPAYSERRDGRITLIRCWSDSFRWKEEFQKEFAELLEKSEPACTFPRVIPDITILHKPNKVDFSEY